ncbi:MAG: hypothetical protein AAGL24_19300 [Pseudomonadota bacterium]
MTLVPKDATRTECNNMNGTGAVTTLAEVAIAALAAGAQAPPPKTRMAELKSLCNALVHPDEHRRHMIVARLVAKGVSVEEIIERYIPEAARFLGDGWVNDDLTFAEVTVGTSRLQEMVRTFSERYVGRGDTMPLGHNILLCVPEFEDHTLGVFVAAERFRRAGLWVQLGIGINAYELSGLMKSQQFTMVGISVSRGKRLASVREFVKTVRSGSGSNVPVILGGSLVDCFDKISECVGADLMSTDPKEAMTYCGLETKPISVPADTRSMPYV